VSQWILDCENLEFFSVNWGGKSTACLLISSEQKLFRPFYFSLLAQPGFCLFFFLFFFIPFYRLALWWWEGGEAGGAIGNKFFSVALQFILPCYCLHLFSSIALFTFSTFSPRRRMLDRKKVVPWAVDSRANCQGATNKCQLTHCANEVPREEKKKGNWEGFRVSRIPIIVIGLFPQPSNGVLIHRTAQTRFLSPTLHRPDSLFWLDSLIIFPLYAKSSEQLPLSLPAKKKKKKKMAQPLMDQSQARMCPCCTSTRRHPTPSPKGPFVIPWFTAIQFRSPLFLLLCWFSCLLTGANLLR
jgi:hypothetical protein